MTQLKRILAIEPYYGGSHKTWIDGWIKRSRHDIQLLTLPARKWKWRMRGAAIELATQFEQTFRHQKWDGLIASDMLNLAEFIALTRPAFDVCPSILYLHENQFSYPLHPDERIDYHYGITNFISVLAATKVVFNSEFNFRDFFDGIEFVLKKMPDCTPDAATIKLLKENSLVLPPCVELPKRKLGLGKKNQIIVILWNHRWDRDKQPEVFLTAMAELVKKEVAFQVIICGEQFEQGSDCFKSAPDILGDRLIHLGYAESRKQYDELLSQSDIVVSTAKQEFFGISIVEAIHAGAFPVLPHRLNYPYLIPSEFHDVVLYEEEQLIGHLEKTIEDAKNDTLPDLSRYMQQYDWAQNIDAYDDLFE